MIKRLLASALTAGCAAGLLAALLHFAFVQDFILLGEQYESGELVHFEASVPASSTATEGAAANHGSGHSMAAPPGTEETTVPAEESNLKRNALTVLFDLLLYVAYALLLVAGFGLAESAGRKVTPQQGVIWGLAGFFMFQMAPAMGLPPVLPGTIAAELEVRQVWWWMTVGCTGTALALLAFGRHWAFFALAGALLALPHVVGAPQPERFWGVAPPEVGAFFAARVLGVGLITWTALGWLAAAVWQREGARA